MLRAHECFKRPDGLVARSSRPKQFTPPAYIVMLACLMNFRFNAVRPELAGGNMSPMRKTAGRKAASTRKRNAAKRPPRARRLRRRVSVERPDKKPQEPVCAGDLQEKQQQPAPAKKRPRSLSQCKSRSRPHQSPRRRRHPKPAFPSKL